MRKFNYAAYKKGNIVSLHNSHEAALRKAGAHGQVLEALPENYPPYTDRLGIAHQVFIAPEETGYHYVTQCGFLDPIY